MEKAAGDKDDGEKDAKVVEEGDEGDGETAMTTEDAEKTEQKELEKGREEYKKGNYEDAIKAWSRSLQSVKYITEKGLYKDKPEQLREVHDMEERMNVNMAQGYLKMGEWNSVVTYADHALARNAKNPKALYRKASALMNLMSFTEAADVLEMLLKVEPDNAAAKQMHSDAVRKARVSERDAKKMSKKMVSEMIRDPDPQPNGTESMSAMLGQVLAAMYALLLSIVLRIRRHAEALLEPLGLGGCGGAKQKKSN